MVSKVRSDGSVPLLGGLDRSSRYRVLDVIWKHTWLRLHKLVNNVELIRKGRWHVTSLLLLLLVGHPVRLVRETP